jgi:hypothetical protein
MLSELLDVVTDFFVQLIVTALCAVGRDRDLCANWIRGGPAGCKQLPRVSACFVSGG